MLLSSSLRMNQQKSSYPIFPFTPDVNFRGASAKTRSTTRYVSAWFPYLRRSSLSIKKSWSPSSSQNRQ